MVVGVGFCKIKVDSNVLLVLKIKCTKFHQDRSKTVDLHTKYANRHSVLYTVCPRIEFTRGKKNLFLILRKNFRGITFFASSETPISVIKKSFSTQRKT
jgi:hypothetical protein